MRLWLSLVMLAVGGALLVLAHFAGPKRFRVRGQRDIDLMKNVAPIVAMRTYNNRYLFSSSGVNPKSLVY
jgi:hypothetical protein